VFQYVVVVTVILLVLIGVSIYLMVEKEKLAETLDERLRQSLSGFDENDPNNNRTVFWNELQKQVRHELVLVRCNNNRSCLLAFEPEGITPCFV
jgi:hypothetical protein